MRCSSASRPVARVLAAGEVQGDPASLLCGHDAGGRTRRCGRRMARAPDAERACWCRRCAALGLRRLPDKFIPCLITFAASSTISHCVEAGRGMPSTCSSFSCAGRTAFRCQYFSSAIIAAVVSSYFPGPMPYEYGAVNTSPHGCSAGDPARTRLLTARHFHTILTEHLGFFLRIRPCPFHGLARIAGVRRGMWHPQLSSRRCTDEAPLRPWPGVLSEGDPNHLQTRAFPGCSKTFFVSSVVRGAGSIPASACNTRSTSSPSDSLNGAVHAQ